MPTSIAFLGSKLFLESVVQSGPTSILARFSQDPLLSSSSGPNDALNLSNYTLIGPSSNTITASSIVSGDPQAVSLTTSSILLAGNWTLTVKNIQTALSDVLVDPKSLIFVSSGATTLASVSGGAQAQTAESILRRHLNPTLVGRGWDALVAGLAAGDTYLFNLAKAAFNQLFKSTASGKYLDRLASDNGLLRPSKIGISDDVFRDLIIKVSAEKITLQSFLQVLETYYGADAVRAVIESSSYEPYNIQEGDDLNIELEGNLIKIVFHQKDFAQLGKAKSIEISAAITRALELNNNTGFAKPVLNKMLNANNVKIYSGALGLKGAVRVLGGKAQNILNFPSIIATTQAIGTQWKVETPIPIPSPTLIANRMRFTFIGGTNPTLQLVRIGDYANIYGDPFNAANRGAFTIVDVNTTYFEIESLNGVNQSSVTQLTTTDITFYRPDKFTVNSKSRFSLAAQGDPNTTDVILAATTQAISRKINSAAYIHANPFIYPMDRIKAVSVERNSGVVTVTTSPAHGLSIGDTFFLAPGDESIGEDFFDGIYTVSGISTFTFDYNENPLFSDVFALTQQYIYPCYRDSNGLVKIKTAAPHGLSTNNFILMDNLKADIAAHPPLYCTVYTNSPPTPVGLGPSDLQFYGFVRLSDGRALLCGGYNNTATNQSGSYIYDSNTSAYTTVASMNVARSKHSITLLDNGRILVTGGNQGAAVATCELYDPTLNVWIVLPTMSVARFGHIAVKLNDGRVLVTGGGSATAEIYNPTANTWTTVAPSSVNRVDGQGIKLNNNTVLVGGGYTNTADPTTSTAVCEVYNPYVNTWETVGSLATARHGHKFILTNVLSGDGRVIAFAGSTNNTVPLSSIEIYEPSTRLWASGASMATGRFYFGISTLNDNTIELSGGSKDGTLIPTFDISIYNPVNNTWKNGVSTTSGNGQAGHTDILLPNGKVLIGPGRFSFSNLLVPVVVPYASGGLNGTFKITVPTSTTFTYSTLDVQDDVRISPIITSFKNKEGTTVNAAFSKQSAAPDALHTGPYIFNPKGGVSITGISTTTNQLIQQNQGYNLLTVTDASKFPSSGFLVFAFGTDQQLGPVQYTSKASNTQLVIDSSFIFTESLSIGTNLILLKDRNPGVPDHPESSGSFYVTDSITGRISAENTIKSIEASGASVEYTITYPGDIGLGNEGLPVSGQPKIADKVFIWGDQNDIDDARND